MGGRVGGAAAGAESAGLLAATCARGGVSAAQALPGCWVALAREGEGPLWVLRDALGAHPLFLCRHGDGWSLSPSLQRLATSAGVDRLALAMALAGDWPPSPTTFREGIVRLGAGEALALEGRVARNQLWQPTGEALPMPAAEFAEVFEAAVARAIGPHRSSACGIFLSGGLDSISVAVAATSLGVRPHALAVRFPDPECDELVHQRGVAERLGLSLTVLDLAEWGEETLLGRALEMSAEMPAPLLNPWLPAYAELVERAAAEGIRLILTGSGGDEWLGVSPYWAADCWRRLDVVSWARLYRASRRAYHLESWALARNLLWRFGLRPVLLAAASRVAPDLLRGRRLAVRKARLPTWHALPGDLAADFDRSLAAQSRSISPPSFYQCEMRRALGHGLVHGELEESFFNGARCGVEVRHPYWDTALVERLLRVPPEDLHRCGISKGLVREYLASRRGAEGAVQRRKALSLNFFRRMVLRGGERALEHLAGLPRLAALGLIDRRRAEAEVRDVLRRGDETRCQGVWALLSVEAWLRGSILDEDLRQSLNEDRTERLGK